jgi:hypothetical protein
MGKPKEVKAAKIGENYNWGEFGGANASGVNLSPTATQTIADTQGGINQYVNELINPSYSNESFRARQALLDASNRQYANELGAQAMERGARGSATQNILNSIMANRNMDMRQAMTQEDARVQNILNALQGVESGYFGQANTMANNILQRVSQNQANQQRVNELNTQAYNQWRNSLLNSAAQLGGAALTGGLSYLVTQPLTSALAKQAGVAGAAIDPMQAMSAANMIS